MEKRDCLNIDRVVFIGRTYFEYLRMFDLDEALLRQGPVLDCAAGPSSFTAEAHAKGLDVRACDILYDGAPERLALRGRQDIDYTFQKVDDVPHLYVWKHYSSRKEIISLRRKALDTFVDDFSGGRADGRYVPADLTRLPFPDHAFSRALCSHFLFLYGDRLDLDFHTSCLRELVRVSSEVRIFPLQSFDAKPYAHMDKCCHFLRQRAFTSRSLPCPSNFRRARTRCW